MADQNQTEQLWKPAANPWLIAAAVMLATFMEVLDTSVANVSLNYIAGSLAVSNDEATWVLNINLPIGILAILMCLRFLEDPPYLKNANPGRIDFFGIGFLALWVGCLQVMLDKGQDDDWFSSNFIRWLAILAVIGFILFLVRQLKTLNPIVDRKSTRLNSSHTVISY